jgi:hypothetical protein
MNEDDPTPAEMDAAERRLADGDRRAAMDATARAFTHGWNAAIDAAAGAVERCHQQWADAPRGSDFTRACYHAAASEIEGRIRALRRTQESPK